MRDSPKRFFPFIAKRSCLEVRILSVLELKFAKIFDFKVDSLKSVP